MKTIQHELVEKFLNYEAQLKAQRAECLPLGTPVYVDADRYRGYGIVSSYADVPAHMVGVILQNGNTWWYQVNTCRRVEWKDVPQENRRAYLKTRVYHFAFYGPRSTLP